MTRRPITVRIGRVYEGDANLRPAGISSVGRSQSQSIRERPTFAAQREKARLETAYWDVIELPVRVVERPDGAWSLTAAGPAVTINPPETE